MIENDFPHGGINSMQAFYGNPDTNHDGHVDLKWEAENIMRVIPPYPMYLAWDTQRRLKTISIHRRCAASLGRCLLAISREFDAEEIDRYELNQFGGAYNFRTVRGGLDLSKHAYGAAIDLAPRLNPLGVEYGSRPNMMPYTAIKIFANEGWVNGYLWTRPDPMHFQAAKD